MTDLKKEDQSDTLPEEVKEIIKKTPEIDKEKLSRELREQVAKASPKKAL